MPSYDEEDNRTYKVDDEGERSMIANFTARIIKETRLIDGQNTETFLTIEGWAFNPANKQKPHKLEPVEVAAGNFSAMGWIMNAWGVRAILSPGHGVKDDLRMVMQLRSNPERIDIYKAMGWETVKGKRAFLHAGGAITEKGNDASVIVRLPSELSKYDLSKWDHSKGKEAFLASLGLTTLVKPSVSWPAWCGCYVPVFGATDFAMHITGRSGTFKSEYTSLIQSHYGSEMDARHLPGSWSSTPNALECQAYYARNAVFTVDDFVPVGTSWQQRAYQTGADKLIRGQGNQAGRARLTDTSGMQTTYFPRGMILSTGEDTPEGHSVRARMMILELSPGDVCVEQLTLCQKQRQLLPMAMADTLRTLAGGGWEIEREAEKIRDEHLRIGHSRTPAMLGRLIAAGVSVLRIAEKKTYIDAKKRAILEEMLRTNVIQAGEDQAKHLEATDPIEIFTQALRQGFAAGLCHARTKNGGIPLEPQLLGWTEERFAGAMTTYKSHGPCVAWIDWDEDTIYVEADQGYSMVKKVAGQELALTKQTLWKRLKEAGLLVRSDDNRQRNTIRVTAEGHQRSVLALSASVTLDRQEKPRVE